MKKIIGLLMVCVIAISVSVGSFAQEGADSFVDVSKGHFAYDAVQYFYRANVLNGVGNNLFAPNEFVTREQFAKMLSIIYNKDNDAATEETFSDVTGDMWSYTYIESVKEYLTGYYPAGGAAFFNPHGKATREDVAYALVRISGLTKSNDDEIAVLEQYKDSSQISVNLREYVAVAISQGLMQGYDKMLRPQDGITRAEVATLLFRAIKKPVDTGKEEITEQEETQTENIEKEKTYQIETNSILQISGYGEDELDGTLLFQWSPANNFAKFDADIKCKNGAFDIVRCRVLLTETISVTENSVIGYFDVSMDSKIRHEHIKGNITIQKDSLKLNTEEYDYRLFASLKPQEKTEDESKKESIETDEYLWADSDMISCQVKSLNDKKASGYFNYIYKEEEKISKIDAGFTAEENKYTIVMVKEISKENGSIKGLFSVWCGDQLIAENTDAEIIGYDAGIGELITFTTADGTLCITMQIVEIST
ncbi:MAG: S-layer homology domain-containing protein [Clostridia bacterium]|nr:S-layer homology domain-containing protein [Clostridia bacterium]